MIEKVLVANRGEIALRVIGACKELGIGTVAVYSEADKGAPHTTFADEAYFLGPPPAIESYLRGEKLIEIAKRTGCDAIHPGYGFLAENADFAERVERNGLAFIGPTPSAIRLMGNKVAARKTMQEQGTPIIPGSGVISLEEERRKSAKRIGYPVLIKAVAGGGGKGIRVVHNEQELKSAFEQATSEAEAAFGNPSIYLEKFIPQVRHIEFQILSDGKGNHVHLGERECSIQRRYQKLVEESPSPILTPELREEMGQVALEVAQACSYRSAGTVEFLYDGEKYYFLEMNTRLQVEHPVTEEVSCIDIVKEQLRIAAGKPLSFDQDGVKMRGTALECRIYAEDPQNNFYPSTGKIEELILPAGPGVRVDHGIYRGEKVTPYYDPLLAKLVCWGEDRDVAIARMRRALAEFQIIGVKTTIGFHLQVMESESFKRGEQSIAFLEGMDREKRISDRELEVLAVAAVLKQVQEDTLCKQERSLYGQESTKGEDGWKAYLPWLEACLR